MAKDHHLLLSQPLLPPVGPVAGAAAPATSDDDKMDVEGGGGAGPRQAMINLDLAGRAVEAAEHPPAQRRAGPALRTGQ